MSIPLAASAGWGGRRWLRFQMRAEHKWRAAQSGYSPVDRLFAQLQILTACYVAFAHGANDVANAIGPLAAIFSVITTRAVALSVEVPFWMLLM